jgi:hypothetical protein
MRGGFAPSFQGNAAPPGHAVVPGIEPLLSSRPLRASIVPSLWSADACALRLLSPFFIDHPATVASNGLRRSIQKKRAPPHRRDAGVRQTLLHPVVQCRTVPDAGGQVVRTDGGSPTGHPPCPEPSTSQSIKPASMREERSSLMIRNLPCLRWGACQRRFCAGMPEPCCLPVRIAPNGGLGLS